MATRRGRDASIHEQPPEERNMSGVGCGARADQAGRADQSRTREFNCPAAPVKAGGYFGMLRQEVRETATLCPRADRLPPAAIRHRKRTARHAFFYKICWECCT